MGTNFGLREVITLLFKHKYKMVIVFVVVAGISYFMAERVPKTYVTKAVIMVNFGREFVPIPEVGDMRLPLPSQEGIINTEIELITGRELISKVIDVVGLKALYPGLSGNELPESRRQEIAIQRFRRDIQAIHAGRGNLIEVFYHHRDPQIASRALAVLIDRLKERHLQVFSTINSPFLEEQLKVYREKLQNSQNSLARFKQTHQLYAGDKQGDLLATQRGQFETQLIQETTRLRELQQKLDFIKTKPGTFFTGGNDLRSQLNLLKRKEQELSQKYNDGSTMMLAVRDDIKLVEQQLKEQEESMRNAEYLNIQAEMAPVKMKITSLKDRVQQLDRQIQAVSTDSVELQDLERAVASNESNYQIYLKKAEEARISENMDQRKMTNISIIQQPSVPMMPDDTKRQKTLNTGLLAALALSVAIALAFEFLPQTFTTPDAVARKLKVPLLATVEHRKLMTLFLIVFLLTFPRMALCGSIGLNWEAGGPTIAGCNVLTTSPGGK